MILTRKIDLQKDFLFFFCAPKYDIMCVNCSRSPQQLTIRTTQCLSKKLDHTQTRLCLENRI
jgi:hypothetical protein